MIWGMILCTLASLAAHKSRNRRVTRVISLPNMILPRRKQSEWAIFMSHLVSFCPCRIVIDVYLFNCAPEIRTNRRASQSGANQKAFSVACLSKFSVWGFDPEKFCRFGYFEGLVVFL